MTRRAESRRARHGRALFVVLAALGVLGISAAVVAARSRTAVTGTEPARYAAGSTVLDKGSLLPAPRLSRAIRVAILRDSASASYYDDPTQLDSIIGRWAAMLREEGAEVRVLSAENRRGTRKNAERNNEASIRVAPRSSAVASALAESHEVLVVPSSPCLGRASRDAIDTTLARGGGVVLTWLAGVRDGGCAPVGWGLVAKLTGATKADTLERRDNNYVTIPDGGPLATDVPPGARVELLAANHVALRLAGRDGYWSDFMLNPEPARSAALLDAAVVHAEHGRGRVVYWGFDLPHVVNRPWNDALARLLARNSVAWAAGEPLPELEPWPGGHAAAAVLAQDVEADFANARYALDTLRAAGVRGTYFLVTDLALRDRPLVDSLARDGEIGTHSDDHRLLGGSDRAEQTRRLSATQRHVRELVGRDAAGLRPPEEQFDDATMVEWVRNGGSYIFGANNSRTASPELLSVDGRRLVLLGRVADDDYATVRKAGVRQPARLAAEYLDAFQKVRALGGLYVLSYHSNLLARPELVPALGRVARALRADSSVWLATAEDVARWWSDRADVALTARRNGGEMTLIARNGGARAVKGAVARLRLQAGDRVTGAEGGTLLPAAGEAARIALPALAPGQSATIRLQLAPGGRP